MDSRRCDEARQKLEEEVARLREPVDGDLPGTRLRRMSGRCTFLNGLGQAVRLRFCGSTHDRTQGELAFLREKLFAELEPTRVLVVEQAFGVAIPGNLLNVVTSLGPPELELGPMIQLGSLRDEMTVLAREAVALGHRVVNGDWQFNPELLLKVCEERGALDALRCACHQLQGVLSNDGAVPRVISHWVQREGLQDTLSQRLIYEEVGGYLGRLSSDLEFRFEERRRLIPSDAEREERMLSTVLTQSADVLLLAHTDHVTALLDLLAPRALSFEAIAMEVSEERLGVWQQLRGQGRLAELNEQIRARRSSL